MASRAFLCAGLLVLAVVGRAAAEPSDMQKWAAVLAQSMLSHAGSKDAAHSQLGMFQELVAQKIGLAAEGKSFQTEMGGGQVASGPKSLFGGAVTVNDPALYTDASAKIVNAVSGAILSATFINYSPCLILTQPYGFGVFANGVNVQPTAVYIVPTGFNVQPQGLNVAPTLIYVGPIGRNISPQGFNVAPALISVAPVYNSVGTPGKTLGDTNPLIIGVTKPRDGEGDTVLTYPNGDTYDTTTGVTTPAPPP